MATFGQRFKTGFNFEEQAFRMLWKEKILWIYWLAFIPASVGFYSRFFLNFSIVSCLCELVINLITVFLINHTYQLLHNKKPTFSSVFITLKPAMLMIIIWCTINFVIHTSILALTFYVQQNWPEFMLYAGQKSSNILSFIILWLGLPWALINCYTLVILTVDQTNFIRAIKLSLLSLKTTWAELGGAWLCIQIPRALYAVLVTGIIILTAPFLDSVKLIFGSFSIIFQLAFIIATTMIYSWHIERPMPPTINY